MPKLINIIVLLVLMCMLFSCGYNTYSLYMFGYDANMLEEKVTSYYVMLTWFNTLASTLLLVCTYFYAVDIKQTNKIYKVLFMITFLLVILLGYLTDVYLGNFNN